MFNCSIKQRLGKEAGLCRGSCCGLSSRSLQIELNFDLLEKMSQSDCSVFMCMKKQWNNPSRLAVLFLEFKAP